MEKQLLVEPLSGGLVTSRDVSLLNPGELTQTDNAAYKPGSQNIHKAPSNILFSNAPFGDSVTGLRYAAFDFVNILCNITQGNVTVTPVGTANFSGVAVGAIVRGEGINEGVTVLTKPNNTTITISTAPTLGDKKLLQFTASNLLVAQSTGSLSTAIAALTAQTFTNIRTIDEGDTLEAVHYANKHVLMNGKNENLVLNSAGALRPHGMKPVTVPPTVVVVAGTWALSTGTGYYAYWTTEYDEVNDLESDFTALRPTVVNITTTSKKATITRPLRVNNSSTHWRVYRSVKMVATTQDQADKENPFPTGVRIAQLEMKDDGTQMSVDDGGGATSTGSFNAGAVGTVGVLQQDVAPFATLTWATPSNAVGAINSTYATLTYATFGSGGFNRPPNFRPVLLELGNFGITGVTAPISGISVSITGKKAGNATLDVVTASTSFPDFPALYYGHQSVPLTTIDSTVVVGGVNDLWVGVGAVAWQPAYFADGKFSIQLYGRVYGAGDSLSIDSVSVIVTYGKNVQSSEVNQFPALTVKPFGITASVGRNGPPPKSTTGDIFQNSLVVNDITDESILRYSYPDKIDSFPSVYFLNFETKDQDTITNIKSLGNMLVVGLRTQIYRVSYLPREVDAEFDRGRAVEMIETNHGIVGTQAATTFTHPELGLTLAYVSLFNPHMTDAYSSRLLTNDLNFEALVDQGKLGKCVLINNPELYELLLYYVPRGSLTPTVLTKCLRFNYHPSHIKEDGSLKVSGPVDVDVSSAALAVLDTGTRPLYTGASSLTGNGNVFLENQGSVLTMTIKTRQMYLAGAGNEWKYDDLYVHHTFYSTNVASPMNIVTSLLVDKINTATRTTATKTIAVPAFSTTDPYPLDAKLSKVIHGEAGEAISTKLVLSSTTFPLSLDYLIIAGQDFKRETSK